MAWDCHAGVEPTNLTTEMEQYNFIPTEFYESIKLGIDAHDRGGIASPGNCTGQLRSRWV